MSLWTRLFGKRRTTTPANSRAAYNASFSDFTDQARYDLKKAELDSKASVMEKDTEAYREMVGNEIKKEQERRDYGTRFWFWPGSRRIREESVRRIHQLYHTLDHLDKIVEKSYETAKAEMQAKRIRPHDEEFYLSHKVSRDLHSIIFEGGKTIYAEQPALSTYHAYLGRTMEDDSYPDRKIEILAERTVPKATASPAYRTLCDALAEYANKEAQGVRLGFFDQRKYEGLMDLRRRWAAIAEEAAYEHLERLPENKLYRPDAETHVLGAVSHHLEKVVRDALNPSASQQNVAGKEQGALGLSLEHVGI